MRRYELMLVLRPDVADDKAQAVIDRTTRQLVADGGQIIKVAPWGRRRLEDGSEESDDTDLPSAEDDEDDDVAERIDESETEAAPAAID
jgi:hypothetical protein